MTFERSSEKSTVQWSVCLRYLYEIEKMFDGMPRRAFLTGKDGIDTTERINRLEMDSFDQTTRLIEDYVRGTPFPPLTDDQGLFVYRLAWIACRIGLIVSDIETEMTPGETLRFLLLKSRLAVEIGLTDSALVASSDV